jgi:uncharacterized membrane protein
MLRLRLDTGLCRFLFKDQRGQSFILMLLILLPLLLFVLGAAYDLGNVAVGVTVAQNGADLAAQEAAKLIDANYYMTFQEVRLRPEAALVAQYTADEVTGGAFGVTGVYVDDRVVIVEGQVEVRTPFLDMFLGRESVTRQVVGVAEAAYGSTRGRDWGE